MIGSEIGGFDPNIHYKVGNEATTSRHRALLLAGGDTSKIQLYFMDHVWDNLDLTKEPTETVDELCDLQCRRLRERYDWLCLWLSGGYDSQTILSSFIRSGIKIDEIAYMDRSSYYQDPEIPFILQSATDYQKYHNPACKIFRANIDNNYTGDLYNRLGEDWIFEPGATLRFSKSIASFIQRHNHQVVKRRLTTPGNRADIYGKEKPRLDLLNGWWYMYVADFAYTEVLGSDTVGFFTSDITPELQVKQVHMAMRWFETLPGVNHDLVHRIQHNEPAYYMGWNLSVGRISVGCPQSAHAIVKQHFAHSDVSIDSKKILDHYRATDKSIFDVYIDAKKQLTSIVGEDNMLKSIKSRKWKIRPFATGKK